MGNWLTADTWFYNLVGSLSDVIWSYLLIALLLILGIYFTIRTGFVQFRMLKEMFVLLFKEGTDRSGFKDRKGTSAFQAFAISTAARVGTGNLAGVALAISAGGPGAIFWMWVIALIGAATGFVESTLAQMYKVKDKDGFRGGPAYYMEQALNARWLGIIFAVLITLCFGFIFNGVQTNTIAQAFNGAYNIPTVYVGLAIMLLIGVIIYGGIRRIAVVAEIIVPIFASLYVIVAVIIMIINIADVPQVFGLIFSQAFGIREVAGGTAGGALMLGIQRGLFSNEAGMGSAPNAAATAYVSHPVKQGLVQSLGVLTDTLIICSATAFIILLSGTYADAGANIEGIQLTQQALAFHLGGWAQTFVSLAIFFFAFSSLLGNYYYGEVNVEFISPKRIYVQIFRVCFLLFVLLGAASGLELVWAMADLFMGLMAVVNLIAIALLGHIVAAALKNYMDQRRQGLDPVFYNDSIPWLKNLKAWGKKR
ncbi:alanine or glycine:cation symporter, AGCS family [Marinococcus luteus]|uniref:Alanine or glycine:cation symporter, AGCS family n=1 Tax=Marinococcus luteus TaxID=1122204 RepID=A0A1H2UFV4_9BACI|nr:alanine/glycine:cation symporter family protein [Marinococcus luteus]SDW54965.1 alanine or glycine:cation symporter, AGCS family [Marinococcus luteus]